VIPSRDVERVSPRRHGRVVHISEHSLRSDEKVKIASAVEGKSIKALWIEAVETRLQELEKKGLLPKGKNYAHGKD
jgi:hypothetical protein